MEYLYQYLWRHSLFGKSLPLKSGGRVEVLYPGILNRDSGPDFFNSRLDFGQGEWAGNVEIHVKASDWYRHGHDRDSAYDSVILHVVGDADREVSVNDGRVLPTVEVSIPVDVKKTYDELMSDRAGVRCGNGIATIPSLSRTDWVETLAIERLQAKSQRIADLLGESGGDWSRVVFVTLARGLGFRLNSLPMEMLAKSIPGNYLGRHSDDLMQLEALLLGQAGMLNASGPDGDVYYDRLKREYDFLRRKYALTPLEPGIWKYSATRPQNFPERRIALLAKAFHDDGSLLLDRLRACDGDLKKTEEAFGWRLEGYWAKNLNFRSRGSERRVPTQLGKQNRQLLVINVAVPVLYTYGVMSGDDRLTDRALGLLEQLPPEKNSRISQWAQAGLEAKDAFRSQALLHLRDSYCDCGRCDECRFAYALIRNGIGPREN